MEAHLPYKSVVLFIACGTMVFAIVFIFAKRQITRFALKSNRVPHAAIGANAPKSLKVEIERRLKRVAAISYEPKLMSENVDNNSEYENYQFYYRMKAVDGLKLFDEQLKELYPAVCRRAGEPLRGFLLEQRLKENGSLCGADTETVDRLADLYEHARHDPVEFKAEHYQELMGLINQLIQHVKRRSNKKTNDGQRASTKPNPTNQAPEADTPEETNIDTKLEKPDSLDLTAPLTLTSATLAAEILSEQGQGDEGTKVTYRPNRVKNSESGALLLTARHSDSSHGSQTDANLLLTDTSQRRHKDHETYL